MSLQKKIFRKIYKLFPYVLNNIKYLLVISHSGGYPWSLTVTYIMSFAYYALVFGNKPFDFIILSNFVNSFVFKKIINNSWLFTLKKSFFSKFKADFFVILRIFDLECLCQTSVKIKIIMFGFVFMKVRKLRSLYRENKELNLHKT